MNVVAARLAATYADDKERGIRVTSLYDSLTGGIRSALYVLWGAVTLVLLIACVNISNLQLARASACCKELGMRAALGAARSRLLRQLFTENLLLAIAGGACGFVLAVIAVRVLRVSAPAGIPRMQNLSIDPMVLCFTAGLALLAGFLFGMLPSFGSSRINVNEALKQGTAKGSDRPQKRWGPVLVAGQIALAMLLFSSAALLIRSYWKLAHVETGLDNRFSAINFESMDRVISSTVARERFETVLLAVFAATALLLAVVGIYGLLSYMVTRRTSELGVRMALGASSGRIVQMILSEAGVLVMVGVSLGLLGSLLAARVLQPLLHQIKATDPATQLVAVASFAVAALAAAYLPARRAAQIDPSKCLRAE